ncbi:MULTISPECIES: hypothetical protein [Mycobacterium]|uniref:Uncharacterized protein n=1 Tax=Mycobacterium kiyosense TaxID=2871094 RepID=A0A9P3Q4D5_9MYCO|nr:MULTISPECIES: hypothetical protein [Mycobacterium]BDB40899.1 hypothetical protein IWGMT90018_13450 [Mycobacterium kiyosense]BDE12695.1 hypothetical protein MKCMC460_15550 [Mycobacterium sp. 20KCMC460]GLB82636.1 hypothetical protein SRL2020028_18920 [Mycobacterium kiyosense]GLB87858.1 hypothetical protein SRL2020130_06750 [Mycobacterium kiyosense]GLB94015.1 hypothetical protein SRL2020226_07910 [Mycobacterium kiyosense]
MSGIGRKRRWGIVFFYLFGAMLLLLTLWGALTGFPWYECLLLSCTAALFLIGPRRLIIRAGIKRIGEKIVCRYIPVYEGYAYFGCVLLPGFGIGGIAEGRASHNIAFTVGGVVLLALAMLLMFGAVMMWQRSFLCITPTTLRVRAFVIGVGADARVMIEIPREHIQSIEPKGVTNGYGIQVEVAYRIAGVGETTKTIDIGPQVSVEPENLLDGLTIWSRGEGADSAEFMDRIERTLRGAPTGRARVDG